MTDDLDLVRTPDAHHPEGTLYTATARHGAAEMARRHAAMGFHEGWGTVAGQLETYARGLA